MEVEKKSFSTFLQKIRTAAQKSHQINKKAVRISVRIKNRYVQLNQKSH